MNNSTQIVYDIGKITDWISAIGTLGAVIVALYLARRERKPRAKVNAKFSYLVYDTGVYRIPCSVSVEIVNVGLAPIYLKECTFKIGKNRRMIFQDGNHIVDKMLSPGELYSHSIQYEPIRKHFLERNIKKYKTQAFFIDGRGRKYKTKIIFRN